MDATFLLFSGGYAPFMRNVPPQRTPPEVLMKRYPLAWFLSLALFGVVVPVRAADDAVLLSRRSGTVEFQRAGADAWKEVIAGHVLQQNDLSRTGSGGSATVNFTEGGRAFMDANSALRVNDAKDGTRLTILAGKVRITLNNAKPGTYVFKTPSSQMAVRGTDFAFFEDAKRFEVGVYEGVVDATIDGRTTSIPTWRGIIYDKATKTTTQLGVGAIHGDFGTLYSTEEFLRDQALARSAGLI